MMTDRKNVLLKANKLSDERLELIQYRIELQRERLRRRAVERELDLLHHQAVDRTGDGLAVAAWDRDDIVQGIESTAGHLRIGVQWHPEYLPQRADQRRLFRYFVDACRALTASA